MDKSENHASQIADMIIPHLPADGVMLDVGGNFGKVSMYVKRKRPDAVIHFFEPVVPFAKNAKERLSGMSGIHINTIGLSDEAATGIIYQEPHNPGWSTLDASFATPEKIQHEVALMKLDHYPLERVDVIKMDVEYWEGKVLKGGRRTIDKHRPIILTELSKGSDDLWYERVGEMERLFDIGYVRVNYNVPKGKLWNILLIPKEKLIPEKSGPVKRVFVVGVGRSGTRTFAMACKHITNFTSGHESHAGKSIGNLVYPENHIEIDGHLSWALPLLVKKYPPGPDTLYVHLLRDRDANVASRARRRSMDIAADLFCFVKCTRHTPDRRLAVAGYVYDMINAIITTTLRTESKYVLTTFIESLPSAWPEFWKRISAEGAYQAALAECSKRYNRGVESKGETVRDEH